MSEGSPPFLDYFWQLASTVPERRAQAAADLVSYLCAKQTLYSTETAKPCFSGTGSRNGVTATAVHNEKETCASQVATNAAAAREILFRDEGEHCVTTVGKLQEVDSGRVVLGSSKRLRRKEFEADSTSGSGRCESSSGNKKKKMARIGSAPKFHSVGSSVACPDVNYTVNRLLAGLASPRACARLGYATALLLLLQCFPQEVDRAELAKAIQQRTRISRVLPAEVKDLLLGRLLGFAVLQQVGFFRCKENLSHCHDVFASLWEAADTKVYLQELTFLLMRLIIVDVAAVQSTPTALQFVASRLQKFSQFVEHIKVSGRSRCSQIGTGDSGRIQRSASEEEQKTASTTEGDNRRGYTSGCEESNSGNLGKVVTGCLPVGLLSLQLHLRWEGICRGWFKTKEQRQHRHGHLLQQKQQRLRQHEQQQQHLGGDSKDLTECGQSNVDVCASFDVKKLLCTPDILAEKHRPLLMQFLLDTTAFHPRLHSLWRVCLRFFLRSKLHTDPKENFLHWWKHVDRAFFGKRFVAVLAGDNEKTKKLPSKKNYLIDNDESPLLAENTTRTLQREFLGLRVAMEVTAYLKHCAVQSAANQAGSKAAMDENAAEGQGGDDMGQTTVTKKRRRLRPAEARELLTDIWTYGEGYTQSIFKHTLGPKKDPLHAMAHFYLKFSRDLIVGNPATADAVCAVLQIPAAPPDSDRSTVNSGCKSDNSKRSKKLPRDSSTLLDTSFELGRLAPQDVELTASVLQSGLIEFLQKDAQSLASMVFDVLSRPLALSVTDSTRILRAWGTAVTFVPFSKAISKNLVQLLFSGFPERELRPAIFLPCIFQTLVEENKLLLSRANPSAAPLQISNFSTWLLYFSLQLVQQLTETRAPFSPPKSFWCLEGAGFSLFSSLLLSILFSTNFCFSLGKKSSTLQRASTAAAGNQSAAQARSATTLPPLFFAVPSDILSAAEAALPHKEQRVSFDRINGMQSVLAADEDTVKQQRRQQRQLQGLGEQQQQSKQYSVKSQPSLMLPALLLGFRTSPSAQVIFKLASVCEMWLERLTDEVLKAWARVLRGTLSTGLDTEGQEMKEQHSVKGERVGEGNLATSAAPEVANASATHNLYQQELASAGESATQQHAVGAVESETTGAQFVLDGKKLIERNEGEGALVWPSVCDFIRGMHAMHLICYTALVASTRDAGKLEYFEKSRFSHVVSFAEIKKNKGEIRMKENSKIKMSNSSKKDRDRCERGKRRMSRPLKFLAFAYGKDASQRADEIKNGKSLPTKQAGQAGLTKNYMAASLSIIAEPHTALSFVQRLTRHKPPKAADTYRNKWCFAEAEDKGAIAPASVENKQDSTGNTLNDIYAVCYEASAKTMELLEFFERSLRVAGSAAATATAEKAALNRHSNARIVGMTGATVVHLGQQSSPVHDADIEDRVKVAGLSAGLQVVALVISFLSLYPYFLSAHLSSTIQHAIVKPDDVQAIEDRKGKKEMNCKPKQTDGDTVPLQPDRSTENFAVPQLSEQEQATEELLEFFDVMAELLAHASEALNSARSSSMYAGASGGLDSRGADNSGADVLKINSGLLSVSEVAPVLQAFLEKAAEAASKLMFADGESFTDGYLRFAGRVLWKALCSFSSQHTLANLLDATLSGSLFRNARQREALDQDEEAVDGDSADDERCIETSTAETSPRNSALGKKGLAQVTEPKDARSLRVYGEDSRTDRFEIVSSKTKPPNNTTDDEFKVQAASAKDECAATTGEESDTTDEDRFSLELDADCVLETLLDSSETFPDANAPFRAVTNKKVSRRRQARQDKQRCLERRLRALCILQIYVHANPHLSGSIFIICALFEGYAKAILLSAHQSDKNLSVVARHYAEKIYRVVQEGCAQIAEALKKYKSVLWAASDIPATSDACPLQVQANGAASFSACERTKSPSANFNAKICLRKIFSRWSESTVIGFCNAFLAWDRQLVRLLRKGQQQEHGKKSRSRVLVKMRSPEEPSSGTAASVSAGLPALIMHAFEDECLLGMKSLCDRLYIKRTMRDNSRLLSKNYKNGTTQTFSTCGDVTYRSSAITKYWEAAELFFARRILEVVESCRRGRQLSRKEDASRIQQLGLTVLLMLIRLEQQTAATFISAQQFCGITAHLKADVKAFFSSNISLSAATTTQHAVDATAPGTVECTDTAGKLRYPLTWRGSAVTQVLAAGLTGWALGRRSSKQQQLDGEFFRCLAEKHPYVLRLIDILGLASCAQRMYVRRECIAIAAAVMKSPFFFNCSWCCSHSQSRPQEISASAIAASFFPQIALVGLLAWGRSKNEFSATWKLKSEFKTEAIKFNQNKKKHLSSSSSRETEQVSVNNTLVEESAEIQGSTLRGSETSLKQITKCEALCDNISNTRSMRSESFPVERDFVRESVPHEVIIASLNTLVALAAPAVKKENNSNFTSAAQLKAYKKELLSTILVVLQTMKKLSSTQQRGSCCIQAPVGNSCQLSSSGAHEVNEGRTHRSVVEVKGNCHEVVMKKHNACVKRCEVDAVSTKKDGSCAVGSGSKRNEETVAKKHAATVAHVDHKTVHGGSNSKDHSHHVWLPPELEQKISEIVARISECSGGKGIQGVANRALRLLEGVSGQIQGKDVVRRREKK